MRAGRFLFLLLPLGACAPVVLNTTIADRAEVRRAMVESVRIGVTTDDEFVLRWGPPFQQAKEGGRTNYIYRSAPQSERFVIVVFDYGIAAEVRSTETEACRGTFAPRVPGYGFDRIETVHSSGWCGPATRPGVPLDAVGPGRGAGAYK
jgi:hypothetical protein